MEYDIILKEEGDDVKNYDMLAHPNYRYIATVIDGAIIFVLNLPLMYISTLFEDSALIGALWIMFLYRVIVYLIFDFMIPVCTKGQTIGRSILHLRLIKDDFSLATWKNYLMRSLIFIQIALFAFVFELTTIAYIEWIVIFVISIILLYNDARRKTVHDYLGKTVVVYDKQFKESAE